MAGARASFQQVDDFDVPFAGKPRRLHRVDHVKRNRDNRLCLGGDRPRFGDPSIPWQLTSGMTCRRRARKPIQQRSTATSRQPRCGAAPGGRSSPPWVTMNRQRGVVDQADRWHGCSAHPGHQKGFDAPTQRQLAAHRRLGQGHSMRSSATLFPAQDNSLTTRLCIFNLLTTCWPPSRQICRFVNC